MNNSTLFCCHVSFECDLTPVGSYVEVKFLSRRLWSPDRVGFTHTPTESNNATVLTDGQISVITALLELRIRGQHDSVLLASANCGFAALSFNYGRSFKEVVMKLSILFNFAQEIACAFL